jgi:hypothetical protein
MECTLPMSNSSLKVVAAETMAREIQVLVPSVSAYCGKTKQRAVSVPILTRIDLLTFPLYASFIHAPYSTLTFAHHEMSNTDAAAPRLSAAHSVWAINSLRASTCSHCMSSTLVNLCVVDKSTLPLAVRCLYSRIRMEQLAGLQERVSDYESVDKSTADE